MFPKIEDPGEIEYEDFNDEDVDESFFPRIEANEGDE
jgi:hypothetical protein